MLRPVPKPTPKPKKQKQGIRRESPKRARQNREYLKVRKELLKEKPFCEARLEGCTVQATEAHHKQGRIGHRLTDKDNLLAVCHNCHTIIELNPKMAKEQGFSISRLV